MNTTSKIFHSLLIATILVWFAPAVAGDAIDCVGDCAVGPYDKGKGNHGHNRVAPHDHESAPPILVAHEHPTDPIVEPEATGWYFGGALGASSSDTPTPSVAAGSEGVEIFSATASTYDRPKDGKDGKGTCTALAKARAGKDPAGTAGAVHVDEKEGAREREVAMGVMEVAVVIPISVDITTPDE